MSKLKNGQDLGKDSILKLLIKFSIPAIIGMVVNMLYNVVDRMYIGNIPNIGGLAITGVGVTMPVTQIITGLGMLIGIGTSASISIAFGKGKKEDAEKYLGNGFLGIVIISLSVAIFGNMFAEQILKLFGASESTLPYALAYIRPLMFGTICNLVAFGLNHSIRSDGNPKTSMYTMILGASINIILDPIFIFGLFGVPRMGVAGAAIATVAGQLLAMTLSVITLIYKNHEVEIKTKGFKFEIKVVKGIFTVGAPSIMMISLGSILVMGLNTILISFSQVAVALFGIYFKLQSFVFMPVSGLTQGAMPILGYNYGAKNKDRFINTLKLGIIVSVIIMAIGNFIFIAFSEELLMIFNASAEMLSIGNVALCTISLSYIPAAFGLLFATAFQAIGKGNLSLLITLLRQIIIILPMAFILSKFIGLTGVWITFPIAEIVAAIFAGLMFIRVSKVDFVLSKDTNLRINDGLGL